MLPMLVTARTKERQDNEKELYDIHVELQSAKYILFWWEFVFPATHKHLRVVRQELKEQPS